MVSQMKNNYRPMSANQSQFNNKLQGDLRSNHWTVGDQKKCQSGAGQAFVTNNMLNFRWVQPVPKPV